jgi:hypothetical protein
MCVVVPESRMNEFFKGYCWSLTLKHAIACPASILAITRPCSHSTGMSGVSDNCLNQGVFDLDELVVHALFPSRLFIAFRSSLSVFNLYSTNLRMVWLGLNHSGAFSGYA